MKPTIITISYFDKTLSMPVYLEVVEESQRDEIVHQAYRRLWEQMWYEVDKGQKLTQ